MAIFLPMLLTPLGLAGDFGLPGFGVAGASGVTIVDNSIITLEIVFFKDADRQARQQDYKKELPKDP